MAAPASVSDYENFKAGCKACLPTILGYWAVALPCGALGVVTGLSMWQIAGLAIFLYAASAQLVFYSLLATHADIWQLTFSTAFINLRYLLTNAYLAKFFKHTTLAEKLIGSLLITDETFGVALQYAKKNNNNLPFYWLLGLNLTAWLNWIIATMTGAFLSASIPVWANDALSFSLVGMFAGLLILSLQASYTKLTDFVVIVAAIICIIILHKHVNKNFIVILTSLISAVIGVIFYKILTHYKNSKG